MTRHYKITAQLVGPYLPAKSIKIGKFDISKSEQPIPAAIPVPPGVTPDSNSCLMRVSQLVEIESPHIVTWEVEAVSSKEAYERAKPELDQLVTGLSLPTPGYKYIAKIARVEHIRIAAGDHDPEGIQSEAVHVIGYGFLGLPEAVASIAESILPLEDKEVSTILGMFKQGIDAEVYGTGNAQLLFFKVLEQVSICTLKRNKAQSSANAPDYSPVLKEIQATLESDSKDETKAKKIKQHAQTLRALDFEQIGERIKRVATVFNFSPEIIGKIDKIVKYRAKVIAHAGSSETEKILDDPRDTREVARIFILSFLSTYYSVDAAKLWELSEVSENNSWYRYTYARSEQQ